MLRRLLQTSRNDDEEGTCKGGSWKYWNSKGDEVDPPKSILEKLRETDESIK